MRRLLIIFFLIPFLIQAQNPRTILKKIQDKFAKKENFVADYNQSIKASNSSSTIKSSGIFYYQKHDHFRIEMKNQIIISDGDTLWNFDKKSKRLIISYMIDEPTTFSLEKFIYDYPPLCVVKLQNKSDSNEDSFIMELKPKDDDLPFQLVKIWSNKDYEIKRFEMTDLLGTLYVFELNNVKYNQSLPRNIFNFLIPKGIQVIDLR
ncbi:MAG: outer-membrane lipoprotein carrier protein LolA [Melioribacteraceae bacterium]|nr:outer-membrane lipoprotein carrier protein LolA [Melioribacteraceae bacterium]